MGDEFKQIEYNKTKDKIISSSRKNYKINEKKPRGFRYCLPYLWL